MSLAWVALLVLLALTPLVLALGVPVPWWVSRARARAAGAEPARRGLLALVPRVDTVLLQVDGTVTTGLLRVVAVDPVEPEHERNLRWFAGALGHAAEQPVGRALARLSSRGRVGAVHEDAESISGLVDRHPVRVGRPDWLGMPQRGAGDLASRVETGVGEGVAAVTVGVQVDERALGWITVDHEVRADAAESVARLRACGVEPVLVSDDDAAAARRLAEQTGVEQSHGGVDEPGRALLVDDLRRRGDRLVAVAGTGSWGRPDLVLSPAGEPDVLLEDLDVARVATALAALRAGARGDRHARRLGLVCTGLGVTLATVLAVLGVSDGGAAGAVAGWALLGCLGVVLAGVRR